MAIDPKTIIENADKVASQIIAEASINKFRSLFFAKMIESMHLKIGIEVGTDMGQFAYEVISKTTMKTLYCVDCRLNDYYNAKKREAVFRKASEKLAPFIKDKKVMIVQKFSVNASTMFADNSIDFIYIDADHSFEGIYTDLKVWVPKVRIGGIIAGYEHTDIFPAKSVVEQFTLKYGYSVRSVGGKIKNWWFVKNVPYSSPIKIMWK